MKVSRFSGQKTTRAGRHEEVIQRRRKTWAQALPQTEKHVPLPGRQQGRVLVACCSASRLS